MQQNARFIAPRDYCASNARQIAAIVSSNRIRLPTATAVLRLNAIALARQFDYPIVLRADPICRIRETQI